MTKQQFIEASVILAEKMAGELYDNYMGSKADPADLYTREQMANDAEVSAPAQAPAPKVIGPYKVRKASTVAVRLSNIAEHFGISCYQMYVVCDESATKYTKDPNGRGMIALADLDFLNQYIGRKYNYFNK